MLAKMSRLSAAWARDIAFTSGCPEMDVSCVRCDGCARLDSRVKLRAAHILLYVICCLEHRVVVWNDSRQITCLEP